MDSQKPGSRVVADLLIGAAGSLVASAIIALINLSARGSPAVTGSAVAAWIIAAGAFVYAVALTRNYMSLARELAGPRKITPTDLRNALDDYIARAVTQAAERAASSLGINKELAKQILDRKTLGRAAVEIARSNQLPWGHKYTTVADRLGVVHEVLTEFEKEITPISDLLKPFA